MKRLWVVAAMMFGVLAMVGTTAVDAGEYRRGGGYSKSSKAKVRGYSRRRGGYSYRYSDSINTYGDSRGKYGSATVFRDPMADQQTDFGPFDHGFFFNSGVAPNGGDSPYLQ